MSVTQYIGARYVPLFAEPIEWDNTRAYEPLTIVVHQGNSYTSRQAVPIGIDILNTEFWALTGNYNAQIEAYREEVERFDRRITDNTDAIGQEITDRLADVYDEEQARIAADNALQGEINDIEQAIQGVNDRYLLLVGDSWLVSTRTLAEQFRMKMGVKAANVRNVAVSGAGFIRPDRTTFEQQLDQLIADSTIPANAEIYLAILGGTNDYPGRSDNPSDYSTIINNMGGKIRAKWPNAKTVFFFLQAKKDDTAYPYSFIERVKRLSIPQVVNAYWPVDYSLFADNLHLNEYGDKLYSKFMAANFGIGTFEARTTKQQLATAFNIPKISGFTVTEAWNEKEISYLVRCVVSETIADGEVSYTNTADFELLSPVSNSPANAQGILSTVAVESKFHTSIKRKAFAIKNYGQCVARTYEGSLSWKYEYTYDN